MITSLVMSYFIYILIKMKSSIIWVLTLAIQLYKLYKYRKLIKGHKSLYLLIKNLEVVSPAQLYQRIGKKIYNAGEYVLCQGLTSSSQTYKTRLDSQLKTIYSKCFVDKMMKIFNVVVEDSRKVLQTIRPSFLKMTDAKANVNIYETTQTQFLTFQNFRKVQIIEKFFKNNRIVSLFKKFLPTKLIQFKYTERYLPDNSHNAVFGKISQNSKGQLFFSNPKTIAPLKANIMEHFKNQIINCTQSYYFLLFLLGTTCLMFYKFDLKKRIQDYLEAQKKETPLDKYEKIVVSDRSCMKCHQKLSASINHPCGHMNTCLQCDVNVDRCQECKKKLKQRINLYAC